MHGRFGRPAPVLAAPFVIVLAVIGGLGLDGSAVLGLVVITTLVGAAWAGAAWEEFRVREVALATGARAAAWTAGGFLVVCGAALLAGTALTLVAGALLAAASLLRRPDPGHEALAGAPLPDEPEGPVVLSPLHPAAPTFRIGSAGSARTVLPPVRALSSWSLGEEWLRTTALLDAAPEPSTREAVAARRGAVLDELERRDPAGFARWLAHGTDRGTNPAEFLHEDPRDGGATG